MRAYRSPFRLFVFGIVGMFLMVAAVDVMFGHWVSTAPEENDEGVFTTRGQAQQRGDIIWGAALLGAGTLLFAGTVIELGRRKPLVEIREDGIFLAVSTTSDEVVVRWGQIESIASGVTVDPNDGGERTELIITVNSRTDLPDEVVGAIWDGAALRIDTHDWSEPVADIALAAQGALEHFRRVREIEAMGQPELTWETAVTAPTSAAAGEQNPGDPEAKDDSA
jgi:hypothetical protein